MVSCDDQRSAIEIKFDPETKRHPGNAQETDRSGHTDQKPAEEGAAREGATEEPEIDSVGKAGQTQPGRNKEHRDADREQVCGSDELEVLSAGLLVDFGAEQTRFESGVPIGGLQPLNVRITRNTSSGDTKAIKVTVAGYLW